jgi:hypothetical protein
MSNRQVIAVPAGNIADTNSTNEVPNPAVGDPQPSGETPLAGLEWVVNVEETDAPAVQVEGTVLARLQFSTDAGATWHTDEELEARLCEDDSAPDPCLTVNGVAKRSLRVGHRFRETFGITDLTQIRFRTVYSSIDRAADPVSEITVNSYLTGPGFGE